MQGAPVVLLEHQVVRELALLQFCTAQGCSGCGEACEKNSQRVAHAELQHNHCTTQALVFESLSAVLQGSHELPVCGTARLGPQQISVQCYAGTRSACREAHRVACTVSASTATFMVWSC